MRQLEEGKVADAVPEPSEEQRKQMIDAAAELLKSPERQQAQVQRIADEYRDFVAGVRPKTDAWRAVHKYVHDGQKHFNEYLEWTDEHNRYGGDVTKYQDEMPSDSDEAEDEYDNDNLGYMDEGDEGDWLVWGRPERQVFALYSLFRSAPTLNAPTVVLHSTKSRFDLPHGPKEEDSNTYATRNAWMPTPGRAYLNKTFVSTSLAPLNDFLSAGPDPQPKLSEFYARRDFKWGCCMCAIIVDPGVPTIPIFMENKDDNHYRRDWHAFDWHGFYGEEQELLLPPGLLYVFLGTQKVTVVDEKATRVLERETKHHFNVFFYRAMLPPGA
tara:strand:- start:201 stop:1181 length:981 start_codon:yes stop_codon:yes gene_type:complete